MRYPFLVSLTLLARTEYRYTSDTTVLDVAAVTGDVFDRPYLDRLGGGELRVDQHQRRVGVVRLGNGRESEVCDHVGAKDDAVC